MSGNRSDLRGGRNRGQVLIMFVLALFALLAFVALGVDVGYMYSVRNDLQRSADAGALAGAYVFNDDGSWLSGAIPLTLRNKAETRARDFATRDPVGPAPLPAGAVTVTFPAVDQIRVDVQDSVNLFFAGVIGIPTATLTATATAEAIRVGQNVECLKPLAVPLPYTDSNMTDDRYDPSDNPIVYYGCGPGTLCQGTNLLSPRHLRIVDDPSITISEVRQYSGRLFALDMCTNGGVGSSTYQNWIESPCGTCGGGSPFVADVGSPIPLRINQSDTPTRAGTQQLINNDNNGAVWNYDSTNYPLLPGSNDYNGDNWIHSPRVIRVILYDPSVVAGPSQTNTSIPVWGFAGFWINGIRSNNCDCHWVLFPFPHIECDTCWYVDGFFVPDSAVGQDNPAPTPIEPSLKMTRLVQ